MMEEDDDMISLVSIINPVVSALTMDLSNWTIFPLEACCIALMTWVFCRDLELRMDLALLMGSSWIKVVGLSPQTGD